LVTLASIGLTLKLRESFKLPDRTPEGLNRYYPNQMALPLRYNYRPVFAGAVSVPSTREREIPLQVLLGISVVGVLVIYL